MEGVSLMSLQHLRQQLHSDTQAGPGPSLFLPSLADTGYREAPLEGRGRVAALTNRALRGPHLWEHG